ncbi:hypothetical protein FEM48_Zijuj06G0171000 [Ziziphus jujuba var. spinosa]|uniref:Protein PSK SIMULATOR 1-like n=1 Tax=Ziziphus jujuba var. spinosa TaxID=714518 RepID=A0A978VAJ0_ZIZJJ|nr:hypothetical protein FEM48_Zijuj06G0171000 [Ziziphus jujuba var. spinosa]
MGGGIRMKARGSTVDLFRESPPHSNGHSSPEYGGLPFEAGCRICPSLVADGTINQLCPPFSFPWVDTVSDGLVPIDTNDGIPCLPKQSAVSKVSEVRSFFGRARSAGFEKAVEVLDTLGSSMSNLSLSSGETGKKTKISILAFEVAKAIIKGAKLMNSLSKDNVKHLKEVVLQSEGVKSLVSTDMDELLKIVAADKREELDSFSREVVRFGNLCKAPEWHNLDRYFEKLRTKLPPWKHSKEESELAMQQLMEWVQYTAELFNQLQELEMFEHNYLQKLQEEDGSNAAQKGEIAHLRGALKNQRKHVSSLKKKSLWSKIFEEVIQKLVDIVHFLHLEIHETFGNSDGDKSVEGYQSNRKMLGPAGIAFNYASIITKVDALDIAELISENYQVPRSRSSPVHPNMRRDLYHLLPHDIKSALRVSLRSFQAEEEFIPAIKAEMDKTLLWLVPLACNTRKSLHSFNWVGEWANERLNMNQKTSGQHDVLRIETLHHADKEKTKTCILELLVWLHHLISQVKFGNGGIWSTVKSSTCFPNHEKSQSSTHRPNYLSPMLTDKDEEMLQDVENKKFIPGISKSQKIDASKTRLSKYDTLSKSSRDSPTSETMKDPLNIGWQSCAPVVDFDIDRIRALDVIDGLDTF